MVQGVTIEKILDTINEFPPMPQTAFRVIQILKKEDFHMTDLVSCISKDMSLTTEILRLANSGVYSPSRTISTLQQAITYLGASNVKNLVISLSSKTLYGSGDIRLLDQKLWEHSLTTAMCSRITAIKIKPDLVEESFIMGLLHDIGQLILSKEMDDFEDVVRQAYNRNLDVRELEEESYHFDHTEVGGLAMNKWELPESFYEVVRWHHNPQKSRYPELTYLICYCNNLVKKHGFGVTSHYNEDWLKRSAKYLEIDEGLENEIVKLLLDIYEREKSLFKI